jgi:hypothetical protein
MLNHHTNVRTALPSVACTHRQDVEKGPELSSGVVQSLNVPPEYASASLTEAALDGFVERPALLLRFRRPIEYNGGTNVRNTIQQPDRADSN